MSKVIGKNKNSHFNYYLEDHFEAGIELLGWEVKSIRAGKVNLKGSFCSFKNDELFISGMHISQYMDVKGDETRARKLLLHKSQLKKLRESSRIKGWSIIPVTIKWSSRGYIKIDIATGKGKNVADKRETIKQRDFERSQRQFPNQ